jgi:hypothetical protein
MGPFELEFLRKFTVFCFPRTEIGEQNARQVFNLLESLAIEVPETGHWWRTASGATPDIGCARLIPAKSGTWSQKDMSAQVPDRSHR